MKRLFALLALAFITGEGFGQYLTGIPDPTVREVYNFSEGDTFEYLYGPGTYGFEVILGRVNNGNTSIVYGYNEFFNNGFNQFNQIDTITDLDSVYYFLWYNEDVCNAFGPCSLVDTFVTYIASDTVWHATGASSTFIETDDGLDTIAIDVFGTFQIGMGLASSGSDMYGGFQLVYAHKADGTIWGAPYYFPTAINQVNDANLNIRIYPNPAHDKFNIQLFNLPTGQLQFKLYEASGRLVNTRSIKSTSTVFQRQNLAAGVYFYELSTGEQTIQRGRVIFD